MTNKIIKINGHDISAIRLKLRGWARLEGLRNEMDSAVSKHGYEQLFSCMVKFIETALVQPHKEIEWLEIPWYDFLDIYSQIVRLNSPTLEFPILRYSSKEEKKLPWEYDGRAWYFWLNLFASNYGWEEDKIADLDIDDALGMYQEISIEGQLSREWEWGLSEMAYPYNKGTKKSEYKALPRPSWMMPIIPKQLPVIKLKKSFLPVGNIIDLQEEERNRKKKKSGI